MISQLSLFGSLDLNFVSLGTFSLLPYIFAVDIILFETFLVASKRN